MTGKPQFIDAVKSGESLGRGLYSYAYVNEPNVANAFVSKTFTAVAMKGDHGSTAPRFYPVSNSALA
jgi:hypothetical protein